MKRMTNKITKYMVDSFMTNVNKLDMFVHKQTHNDRLGTVKLVKSAAESKSGKRMFSVKNSIVRPGSYTYAGLREKLYAAC